jgi:hypothetical protein
VTRLHLYDQTHLNPTGLRPLLCRGDAGKRLQLGLDLVVALWVGRDSMADPAQKEPAKSVQVFGRKVGGCPWEGQRSGGALTTA